LRCAAGAELGEAPLQRGGVGLERRGHVQRRPRRGASARLGAGEVEGLARLDAGRAEGGLDARGGGAGLAAE
jgi:hypothetical protein